jgi:hypothetical protein
MRDPLRRPEDGAGTAEAYREGKEGLGGDVSRRGVVRLARGEGINGESRGISFVRECDAPEK